MKCLTLLGTASIQGYIFRSNRLKENIGASRLVVTSIERWKRHAGRVLFVGGGNAAIQFDSRAAAEKAVWEWSVQWLEKAPGLRFAVAHVEYSEGRLAQAYAQAQKQLFEPENRPPYGREPGALAVVRSCGSTGLAASDYSEEAWVSAETKAKHRSVDDANIALRGRYQACLRNGSLEFPLELQHLGLTEGATQIAIVHADGNGIGELLRVATEGGGGDDGFISRISAVSEKITQLANDAFMTTLLHLSEHLEWLENREIVKIHSEGKVKHFPLRPLVDGGDDLTFVCHGKLGLRLAADYLDNFERLGRERFLSQELTACAGVVIMPQKFPFSRGYQLASDLINEAKRARRERGRTGSWLDFQIVLEGSSGDLRQMRSRTYRQNGNWMLRRPYKIGEEGPQYGWEWFESIWKKFSEGDLKWPRSRTKRLLDALARGERESRRLVEEYESRNWELPDRHPVWETADRTRGTRYFDPIEALDFHVVWPEKSEQEAEV